MLAHLILRIHKASSLASNACVFISFTMANRLIIHDSQDLFRLLGETPNPRYRVCATACCSFTENGEVVDAYLLMEIVLSETPSYDPQAMGARIRARVVKVNTTPDGWFISASSFPVIADEDGVVWGADFMHASRIIMRPVAGQGALVPIMHSALVMLRRTSSSQTPLVTEVNGVEQMDTMVDMEMRVLYFTCVQHIDQGRERWIMATSDALTALDSVIWEEIIDCNTEVHGDSQRVDVILYDSAYRFIVNRSLGRLAPSLPMIFHKLPGHAETVHFTCPQHPGETFALMPNKYSEAARTYVILAHVSPIQRHAEYESAEGRRVRGKPYYVTSIVSLEIPLPAGDTFRQIGVRCQVDVSDPLLPVHVYVRDNYAQASGACFIYKFTVSDAIQRFLTQPRGVRRRPPILFPVFPIQNFVNNFYAYVSVDWSVITPSSTTSYTLAQLEQALVFTGTSSRFNSVFETYETLNPALAALVTYLLRSGIRRTSASMSFLPFPTSFDYLARERVYGYTQVPVSTDSVIEEENLDGVAVQEHYGLPASDPPVCNFFNLMRYIMGEDGYNIESVPSILVDANSTPVQSEHDWEGAVMLEGRGSFLKTGAISQQNFLVDLCCRLFVNGVPHRFGSRRRANRREVDWRRWGTRRPLFAP